MHCLHVLLPPNKKLDYNLEKSTYSTVYVKKCMWLHF